MIKTQNKTKQQQQQQQQPETKMTTSGVKKDPHTKGSKDRYLLGQNTRWNSRVIPFIKLQNYT